jgi:hypothetical protein
MTVIARARKPVAVLAAVLAGAVLMLAWISSAPPASNPDGVFHLVSIWCAEGTNETDCVAVPDDPELVLVPRAVQQAACFAYNPLVTGSCAQQHYDAPLGVLAPISSGNLSGARPELYYRTMHRLKDDDVLRSVTRMRVANATAGVVLLLLTSVLATPMVRHGLHAAWLLTSVPLGVWLLSTTNTGAWMIAGVGTAWANLLTATDPAAGRGRRLGAGALALVGAVMGLGARTEAAVPVAVAIAAVAILRIRRSPDRREEQDRQRDVGRIALFVLAILMVVAIAMLLPRTAQIGQPVAELRMGLETLRSRGAGNPLLHLLLTMPSLLLGALGIGWGLGWIDVLVPVPVGAITFGAWCAVLIAGLRGVPARRATAVTLLGLVAVLFPTFTLAYYGLYVGEQFQPRHYVILLHMVMGFALLREPGRRPLLTGRQPIALILALTAAHSHLLHQNTRRYVTGLRSEIYFDLGRDAGWWWTNWPIGPTANWLMGSAAFAVVAWALSRALVDAAAPLERTGTSVR